MSVMSNRASAGVICLFLVSLSSREPNTTRWCGGCGLFDLLNVTTTTTMKKVTSRFVRFLLITLKVNA